MARVPMFTSQRRRSLSLSLSLSHPRVLLFLSFSFPFVLLFASASVRRASPLHSLLCVLFSVLFSPGLPQFDLRHALFLLSLFILVHSRRPEKKKRAGNVSH